MVSYVTDNNVWAWMDVNNIRIFNNASNVNSQMTCTIPVKSGDMFQGDGRSYAWAAYFYPMG